MPIIRRETDYALRALVRLALDGGSLAVSTLAEEEEVPPEFLRKIMQRLNQAGIVESSQGPFGGYKLARPAERVTLLDVVETVQGPLVMSECIRTAKLCGKARSCPFRSCLTGLQEGLHARLAKVRISDAAEKLRAEKGAVK